jgi:site-specific DNA-cytosine methylase
MQISPKTIQKLRLLCREFLNEPKLTRTVHNEQLISYGVSASLWTLNSDEVSLTSAGVGLAKASHWRLWNPNKETIKLVGVENAKRFFISKKAYLNRPTIVDLFCGVGGLSSGFHAAGFDVALAIDSDKEACEAHLKNFPETIVEQSDINDIVNNIDDFFHSRLGDNPVNGVIGGPPCQGFSYMGERNQGDERNLLTSRYMDVVMHLKPDFFVMENVPGLATSGLPIKLSTYIKKLGKSIGEYASNIVDALPSISKTVAKRDRQYRKKLVSGCVIQFAEQLSEQLASLEISAQYLANEMDFFHTQFEKLLESKIAAAYGDVFDVKAFVKQCDDDINIIIFSNVIDVLLNDKRLKDSECETFLKDLSSYLPAGNRLRKTIDRIIFGYDRTPPSGVHKGCTVGPILLHLIERASELYEVSKPEVLNSAQFGTPQNRKRMFLVGIRKDLKVDYLHPCPTHSIGGVDGLKPTPNCLEAIGDLPDIDLFDSLIDGHEIPMKDCKKDITDYQSRMRLEDILDGDMSLPRETWNSDLLDCNNRTIHAPHVIDRLRILEPGKTEPTSHKPRLHASKQSPTLRAGTRENKGSHTAVRPIHYEHLRVISVREGARLMGYPDWMTFHKTKWHGFRLVGNGVPHDLAKSVACSIKSTLY